MLSRLVLPALVAAAVLPSTAAATSVVVPSTRISIAMSPASPRAGSEVRLTGGAGAPSYAWDLDGDGQFDDDSGLDVTTSFGDGTHTVRARAVTAVGVVEDSRTFTVHNWNVPPGGTVGATPYTARVGAPVTIKAEGNDPDGLGVQTALDLDGDGTFETPGATGTANFATPGGRVIRARFTDDAGATSVATTTLEVHTGNIAPTVRMPAPVATVASASAAADDPPSGLSWSAIDPDGEVVRYEYDLDGDGTFETDRGRDARIPSRAFDRDIISVRVTDDGGATAVERVSKYWWPEFPRVAQVGVPIKLSSGSGVIAWDADGDGDFDDGTGSQITFTYPSAGTYEVRVRASNSREYVETISVRDFADIAVPTAQWGKLPPVHAGARAYLSFGVSGPMNADASLDLDGNGLFGDGPVTPYSVWWTFGAAATVGLKATDPSGRTAVTTTPVPFVPGDLGPDAIMATYDTATPLPATYRRATILGGGSDADDGAACCPAIAWDADNDGEYDDGPNLTPTSEDGPIPASFGLRVTDGAGIATTVRRTVGPIAVATSKPAVPAWLRLTPKRPHLTTLLRRGLTISVTCTQPKCRTRLVARVDAKTAKKLKLHSRIVASRTVTGTHRVSLKLTAKARKALKHVRSVTLTLTATATAGTARSAQTTKLTIRR